MILDKLKKLNVHLVYWQTDSLDKKSQKAVKKLHGFLASKQATYLIDLKKLDPTPKKAKEIKTYKAKTPTTEMKNLSLQIGELSRFGLDPKLPKKGKINERWKLRVNIKIDPEQWAR